MSEARGASIWSTTITGCALSTPLLAVNVYRSWLWPRRALSWSGRSLVVAGAWSRVAQRFTYHLTRPRGAEVSVVRELVRSGDRSAAVSVRAALERQARERNWYGRDLMAQWRPLPPSGYLAEAARHASSSRLLTCCRWLVRRASRSWVERCVLARDMRPVGDGDVGPPCGHRGYARPTLAHTLRRFVIRPMVRLRPSHRPYWTCASTGRTCRLR